MSTSDLKIRHRVEYSRTQEDGSNTYFKVDVPLSTRVVQEAENGDAMKQEDVMLAFELRLRRSQPDAPVPDEIEWGHFLHPIRPSTEE